MAAAAQRPMDSRPSRKRGFAVLITLGLVTLLGLLVLALTTQVRLESRISDRAVREAQARQHALMAMRLALGRLQKFAGPDSRITATSEAFGGGEGMRYYSGVWDAMTTGASPLTWLVSGNEGSDPVAITPLASGDAIELVGNPQLGLGTRRHGRRDRPSRPWACRDRRGAVVTGHYAWWVGDEGVKADVAIADRTDEITLAPFDSPDARRRIRQQLALGAGPADAAGEMAFEPRDGRKLAAGTNDHCPERASISASSGRGGRRRARLGAEAFS